MIDIYWPKIIAWTATVLCVIASARGATVFTKDSPRVFTILALFSLNWALLIPFYSTPDPSILSAGFAGFLLVYVGVLLRREYHSPLTNESGNIPNTSRETKDDTATPTTIERVIRVDRGDRISLWLLGLLVTPSLASLPFLPSFVSINRSYTEPVITSILTYIGYFSVCGAIRKYSRRKYGWWILTAIAVPYALADAAFTYKFLIHIHQSLTHPTPPSNQNPVDFWRSPSEIMSGEYLCLFAVLKLLFSIVFIYLVLDASLSEEDRKLSSIDRFLKFVGV
jgi:hypothetical protein